MSEATNIETIIRGKVAEPYATRLLQRIQRCPERGCWLWIGSKTVRGAYAQANVGKIVRVHRWLYERLRGSVAGHLDLDHLCRVRHCINPDHLEPVTRRENLRRGVGGKPSSVCASGHAVAGDNIYTRPGSGRKECLTCKQQRRSRRASC